MGEKEKRTHKAPGRFERAGLSLVELLRMFPSDRAAERWFEKARWPNGVACPHCGDMNVADKPRKANRVAGYRCRGCRSDFTVKTGTVMHDSKLGCQKWAIAAYQMSTNLKSVSIMKLARDLKVTQKTAWFLLQRIREAMSGGDPLFSGPLEADETYVGGLEKNKHHHKRMKAAGGPVGKAIVAGVRDRETGRVAAHVVPDTSARTLTKIVADHADPGATVFTDEARGYLPLNSLGYEHQVVKHSTGQYVDGMAHTNGLESFWATMKRGYHGVYHQMSHEHLHRYVAEFQHRHNQRPMDTIEQMGRMVRGMDHKRLTYAQLIENGVRANKMMEVLF